MTTKVNKSQGNKIDKSLYNSINCAVEQTTIALSVPGVIDQFVKLCAIAPSEVYSLMFWDNSIIKSILSDNINAYCPTKKKIDSFKTFINYTLFKKLTPPKFKHKDSKINGKNVLKSISHKIRYCKLIFLLAQNQFNRFELLSESANNNNNNNDNDDENKDSDDEETDISYETIGGPLILQILFNVLSEALDNFGAIIDINPYKLTCIPSKSNNDNDNDNEDTKMKDNEIISQYSSKFIIKSLDLIKWCFCGIFMISWTAQSRMEIVDYDNGIIIKQMINFFIILKYFISNNLNNAYIVECVDNIRSIFLLLKKLCKTVPFPQNIYCGHNGAILLISEILIYCKSLNVEYKDNDNNLSENEWEIIKDRLLNIYFHGISVLEFINKQCDFVKDHLQRYQRTNNQLTHICLNRRVCRNLCFGFKKYYLRFCKKCGNDLFKTFHEKYIEEDGINIFIPDQVSIKEYKNYYFIALKKFCKQTEFKQFDNDNMFNIIVEYLDYECFVGDYIDLKDELGNWCLFKIKKIDQRNMYQHRIKIGFADYNKKWDQWIDCRSNRIDHPMTHTKATALTRDDML